jgi:class 3 adenylate cyclase
MSNALPARHAELVRGAVLFADVLGFGHLSRDLGTETAYLVVTRCLRLLDGIARKHGGSVDKYLGDKLIAVFGYPVPLEHPSRAAADAALEMRQRVIDYNREADVPLPLGIHIGVNTGAFVGGDVRAGPVAREFNVLGDAVNTAARFNARAGDGQILVGGLTWEETRDRFEYRALEPLNLKGKARPVPAYELVAAHEVSTQGRLGFDERIFASLVGREMELRRLTRWAEGPARGRGGLVILEGEEGIGKSRLLAELGASEVLGKLDTVQIQVAVADRERPLRGIGRLLSAWAGIGAGDTADERRAKLGTALARRSTAAEVQAVLPWLAALLHAPLPGAAGRGVHGLPAAERTARTGEAVVRAFCPDAAASPVLLLLEEAQWLDPESLSLLEALLDAAEDRPILVIASQRPEGEAAERLRERARSRPAEAAEVIELAPLDDAEAGRLVTAVAGRSAVDDETVSLVVGRSSGNPARLVMASFLAPALRREREQEAGRGRTSEAERRRATVLFADISGFTSMTEQIGAEAAYPVVSAALQELDAVARSHGGTVDKHHGDCVMALFGVPQAIEDAPRAAVNAAIDIRRRIQVFNDEHGLEQRLDVHTGVATGLGIAGDISGPMIREFAVMGDHVDRADRLTHVAEAGEIRIDAATQRATRDVFEFGQAERLLLPGSAEPEPTWDLLSTAPRLHRARLGAERQVFSELVGREQELATLRAAIAALASGRGGVGSLVAEAGLGKSRLTAELRGGDEPVIWLEGRALSNGRNLSYHPIADLVRSWAGIDDEDDEKQAREKLDASVRALLPDSVDDTAPLLANLLGAPLTPEERERLDATQGDALEKLVRAAIVQLLRAAAAQRPLVIVMEDLHWADLSSVELLESMLRLADEHPILFLNAFRPGFEETSGRVLAFAREHLPERHVEVVIEPLGAGAARALVKNLFRGGDVPQRTRAAIEERARGNPFYIEEVVRTLVDAGAVEFRDGGFHATEKLDSVAIPDTVQEAVMARVDRLDLRRKSVLQAASVVGGSFHLDVLEAMIEDRDDVPAVLAELEDAEFIVPSDRTAGIEYAFRHPLIQEVTYDAILEARRRELHLEVAQAAEACLSASLPGYCAMLAYHFGMGRAAERAEEYLFRAGDEATRAAASNEALHFFEAASTLYAELHGEAGDPEKRARLEKSLSIALLNRGRLIEAVDHFDQTAQLLGAPVHRGTLAMGAGFAGNLARVLGRLYLRRRPYGRRAASERERELLDVMFRRAMAQSTTAPTRFFVDSMALLRRLSKVDPYTVPESAAMYSGVVAIFSFGGLSFGVGQRFLDIARELAEGGAVDERVLYYRTLRFLHHLLAGDWSDAHVIEPEVVDEGVREGRFWEASTYTNLDGVKQVYQGHFAEARQRIAKLAEIADLYEHDLAASSQHAVTAYLHVERREFEPALRALELYYDEHSEAAFNLLALGTRAKVSSLMGDADAAEASLTRAEAVMSEAGRVAPYHASSVRSARYLADVMALERAVAEGNGAATDAGRQVSQSRKAALATADKVAFRRPEALRLAGREAWLRGRAAEAFGWWERAVDCCTRLGTRPELGRTLADAGRALAEGPGGASDLRGRDASTCLSEARAIFDELDLQVDRASVPD